MTYSTKLLATLLLASSVTLGLTGCPAIVPALEFGAESLPSLLQSIQPIIAKSDDKSAAIAKAQTALNLLQTVNNGEFPSELAINSALVNRGKNCLTDAEYVQMMNALGPAFQKLVTDAQAQPGGVQLVQQRVSNAIVQAQDKL